MSSQTNLLQIANTSGENLRDLIEIDPTARVVRLRFKRGVDLESLGIPADLDIDKYLSEELQNFTLVETNTKSLNGDTAVFIPNEELMQTRNLDSIRVLVEGDSWARYPEFLFSPRAIGTQLQWNRALTVRNIAHWGDLLSDILARKQYLTAINEFQPEHMILSAGGNDLQVNISNSIYEFTPGHPWDQYLTPHGQQLLTSIQTMYHQLIQEVLAAKPDIQLLIYGYDYPRPWESLDDETGYGNESLYIGQYLTAMMFSEEDMPKVLQPLIDAYNTHIAAVAKQYQQVTYVDCRGITNGLGWADDMHPSTKGYARMCNAFLEHIYD